MNVWCCCSNNLCYFSHFLPLFLCDNDDNTCNINNNSHSLSCTHTGSRSKQWQGRLTRASLDHTSALCLLRPPCPAAAGRQVHLWRPHQMHGRQTEVCVCVYIYIVCICTVWYFTDWSSRISLSLCLSHTYTQLQVLMDIVYVNMCYCIIIYRHLQTYACIRCANVCVQYKYINMFMCIIIIYRLLKGRMKARQRKLHQIARLLELPGHLQPCPSPPAHALHTMRQEAHRMYSCNMYYVTYTHLHICIHSTAVI